MNTPLDRVLARLKNVKTTMNAYTALCPAHDDHSNSLSVREADDGKVLLNCFVGCKPEDIVKSIDLEMSDLFPSESHQSTVGNRHRAASASISIKALAVDKELPFTFLVDLGLTERKDGVIIGYRLADGSPAPRQRLRTALRAKAGSLWLFGKGRILPYGLWRREEAVKAGYALLVEGESDCWSAWYHEVPALGIPGSSMVRTLQAEHVQGIGKLFVLREPDLGGERFVAGVAARLRTIGWNGEAFVLTLPQGIKDVNELHKANSTGFNDALAAALKSAIPLALADVPDVPDGKPQKSAAESEPRQTDTLLELAEDMELFHDPNKDPFASFQVGEHIETWPIRSRAFRRFLAREFYRAEGRPPNAQTLKAAIDVVEARAMFDGPELPIFLRLAEFEGRVYLDLANVLWQAVEITTLGYRVVSELPVKFRRTRGMMSLPHPQSGGSVNELRRFLNAESDSDWHLMLSWLLASLRPRGPYPVLILNGAQGSAKSTAIDVLRSFCDPNTVPLRAEPRDVRDLMIAGNNSWCLCLDNVSHLKPWLSDALCRLSTGGGFSTRALFTDADEMLFDAQRPVALNGIEEIATRSDLLDRSLVLTLPEIPDERRIDEERLVADLEEARPRILGALLQSVCAGIQVLPTVHLAKSPRMADFARWATAVGPSLGWSPGTFLNSYAGNRENVNQLALEASTVAVAVFQIEQFEGIASDLLQLLEQHVSESIRRQEEWPKTARALSGALRRIAPNLRAAGVEVTFTREPIARRRRLISIKRKPGSTVHTVQTVHAETSPEPNTPGIKELGTAKQVDAKPSSLDAKPQVLDANAETLDEDRTQPQRQKLPLLQQLDDVDGVDAKIPVCPTPAREDASDGSADAPIPVGLPDDDSEIIE